jgi:hypothetical protein
MGMDTMERLAVLHQRALKLARSAAELGEAAESLQSEIFALTARQGASRGTPVPEAQPAQAPAAAQLDPQERVDPVILDTVIDCKIKQAWNYDIYSVIERLKVAGIPALIARSKTNGTPYINVTSGDLIQSLSDGGNSMTFRWYGAGQ